MRTLREIPFAPDDINDFRRALQEFKKSRDQKDGRLVDLYEGSVNGSPVGIILVYEDV